MKINLPFTALALALTIATTTAKADFCTNASGTWEGEWNSDYAGHIQHDTAKMVIISSGGTMNILVTTNSGMNDQSLSGICSNNNFIVKGTAQTSLGPYAMQLSGQLTASTLTFTGEVGMEETVQGEVNKS